MAEQDLAGRVCLVTGANTGIGRITARELARAGARVILACRSQEKTEPVIDNMKAETGNENIDFLRLDLAELAQVKSAAEDFLARDLPLHLLVNNAGLAGHRGQTRDGFELHFGVNHLGPYLFTRLLLPRLEASRPARIVNVASQAHYKVDEIDYEALQRKTRSVTGFKEYCVSKLANVLFNMELARRLPEGVTTYALHPGVIKSDIWRRVPWPIRPLMSLNMIGVEEGAQTSLHCATAPELAEESGLYYDKCEPKAVNRAATPELAAELWERSEEWCAEYL